ncbi:hypothetical protein ACI2KS_12900, partial [Pseudomonas sp. NPDC087358]|uniref:hypothetical protein n=1 Tax=Pseudomonas sp. NPDC087358 TaxID=3364439 RepID=UPI00384D1C4F
QSCFCPEGVGVRLADDLARSGSKPCQRGVPDTAGAPDSTAGARQIAGQARSYRFSARFKHHGMPQSCFCPEGVGVRLADDLARSGSKPCQRGVPDTTRAPDSTAGARQIAGKPGSHALRAEAESGAAPDQGA